MPSFFYGNSEDAFKEEFVTSDGEATLYLRKALENYYWAPWHALHSAINLKLCSQLEMRPPILDIGCHDGTFSRMLFKGRKIDCGIDIYGEALKKADITGSYKELRNEHAASMSFADGSFNTVICNNVLHDIPDLERTLEEISRVLRHGGKFIGAVQSEQFVKNRFFYVIFQRLGLTKVANWYAERKSKIQHPSIEPFYLNHYNKEEWEGKLRKVHLVPQRIEYFFPKRINLLWSIAHLPFIFWPFRMTKLLNYPFVKKPMVFLLYRLLKQTYLKGLSKDDEEGGFLFMVANKG